MEGARSPGEPRDRRKGRDIRQRLFSEPRRSLRSGHGRDGHILAIDLDQPGRWNVWLQGDRLRPVVPEYPGSNGIKIREGWAWITVSGRRLMVRVPIHPDGFAGDIEIAATRLLADDFAFGMSGSFYVTTHPEHTLVRLHPSGARTTRAGPEEGMVGSTACAFGRAPGDEKAIYVTTDGGFLIPHEGGVQDAKLVRMEVGESGWPLLQGQKRATRKGSCAKS